MSSSIRRLFPWYGPDNRLSPLKLAVFVALFVPGLCVAYALNQSLLGPRPINQAIHEIGLWGIRLILLSLAVTPLRQILHWPHLILVRRMIGVGAFAYIAIHLVLYVVDENYNLLKVASEIYLRIYLTIGFVALLGLAALAATSTDAMIARLGARNWQRLHRLIYGIAILGSIHFFMQSKADVWEPLWMTGLLSWLIGYRLLQAWRRRRGPPSTAWLAGLAVAAGLFMAVGEAAYYWILMGTDPLLVLDANLGTFAGLRPSWIVLAVTFTIAVAGALRNGLMKREAAKPRSLRTVADVRPSSTG